jgi:glutamyl-tRNA reductase
VKLLIVGVSHRTAPVAVLERLSIPPGAAPKLVDALLTQEYVGEALMLSTCNRVEVYAGVTAFHGGLADIGAVLAAQAGYSQSELAEYLYVHYDADAVHHAYRVATGLDSMVVGEAQILGQLRDAYGRAVEQDAVGSLLHELMQQALRVGKRAHAENGIDRAGQSVVSAALGLAGPVAGRSALVNGAGSMGGLALAALRRAGADPLYVTSRSPERAARQAALYDAVPVPELDLSNVDLLITATASIGHVIEARHIAGPITILDLAVPRDVDPAVAELPGVRLIDIAQVGDAVREDSAAVADREQVERLVAGEVAAFMAWLRSANVAPTVAALRARADDVVAVELRRLAQRLPELTEPERAEVARTVHRVVQRLLHQPTVRVRRLAAEPGGDRYTQLLRELFDLEVPEPGPVAEIPEVS